MNPGNYTTRFVISRDGTKIGYRQFGKGPGLILVHGGMMASQNLMKLGEFLADEFTIYIPDRQGRGLSQAHENFGLIAEAEDLQALVHQTGAENIYGLSAGAVVTLQAAIMEKSIKRIVLHEPPVLTETTNDIPWADNYNTAMKKGNYGKAFIHIVKGTDDPSSFFNRLPSFMSVPLMNFAIKSEAKKVKENSDDVTLKALITAMRYDIQLIEDSRGIIQEITKIDAAVLLLKGQKSQPYLKNTIDQLSATFPKSTCVELVRQGHTVSDNTGKPELVAAELRKFLVN